MKIKKILLLIILICCILFIFLFNWVEPYTNNKEVNIYYGNGDNWMATFTFLKVNGAYYEAMYIQNLYDSDISSEEFDRLSEAIGPIEYELIGDPYYHSFSAFPKPLVGYLSYQHAGISSYQEYPMEDTMTLTITWKGNKELITLNRDQ